MKANNEPYSKRGFIILLIIGFFALTGIFLKQYGQFMLGLLIILGTLGYKEISLRISSGSKRPTIKEFIIIILMIGIYIFGYELFDNFKNLASIPFGLVFVNYVKLFLPKGSNWKSDTILILSSIILIILAINLNGAIKAFDYYLERYNNRTEYLLEEGLSLHENGKDIEAIGILNKVIELDSKNIDAYYGKGTIVHQLGRYEEALTIFNKILTISPIHQPTYLRRGLTLQKLNRLDESIESFSKAIELDPNDAYSYDGKGNTLSQLGKYSDAMIMYEKSIQLNPNHDLPYYARGVLLMRNNKYGEATEMFDKCLEINPKNSKCQQAKQIINKEMDALLAPLIDQLK